METRDIKATRITIGDAELWTAPFGENKAAISANEGGMKKYLLNLHKKMPDVFELLVDEEDFNEEEDMDGTFTVIVDPEVVSMAFILGEGKMGFTVSSPCDEDCEKCSYNTSCENSHQEESETEGQKEETDE